MRRPGRATDEGAAAVEFAIISLLLLSILFGIIQYGFYFFQATSVESAAREGARSASIGVSDCTAWKNKVKGTAPGVAASMTSIKFTGGATRGSDIAVTVEWDPIIVGFVPLPSNVGTQKAITRAERLGTVTGGCA